MLNTASGGTSPDIPINFAPGGIRTPYGTLLPPGSQIAAYLRNDGSGTGTVFAPKSGDDAIMNKLGVGTLAQALARVRAGVGDTIIALPGHLENVVDNTMLSGLIAGTNLFGVTRGSLTPTFRWTNTAGNWTFNKNDCSFAGLRLRMEGANGIVQAINWTGADCSLSDCDIEVASGAALKATIAIELSNASAARARIIGNKWRGTNTHNVTNGLLISAAVDQLEVARNRMFFSATAANGCINITAAALNCYIGWNTVYNTMTASTAGINIGNVAADGILEYNNVGILTNGVASTTGIVIGAAALFKGFQDFVSDEPIHSGVLNPIVVAT